MINGLHGKMRRTNMATNGSSGGGGYQILPMPQIIAPPQQNGGAIPTTANDPPVATDPLASVMGMLDGEVMGIPIKYLAIAAVAYFMMKK